MSCMIKDEEWHDCDWIGTIKKNNHENTMDAIENYDDYDERKKRKGKSQWKDLI